MLSVLIPTFDYFTYPLVETLHKQLEIIDIDFEIICIDNGSNSETNQRNQLINSLSNARFIGNINNLGRSGVRNLLAEKAKFDWFLFLDSDVMPTSPDFIRSYLPMMKNEEKVYCGGLAYDRESLDQSKLRYKYGIRHEEVSCDARQKLPYKYFLPSNFLIHKSVFSSVKFNENITKYGYEDLLFAKALKQHSIQIHHLENRVYHLGIHDNEDFMQKSEEALENLVKLVSDGVVDESDTLIFTTYKRFKSFGFDRILDRFSTKLRELAVAQSSLTFFQLYRVSFLGKLLKNSK